jgi:hypothetical protein
LTEAGRRFLMPPVACRGCPEGKKQSRIGAQGASLSAVHIGRVAPRLSSAAEPPFIAEPPTPGPPAGLDHLESPAFRWGYPQVVRQTVRGWPAHKGAQRASSCREGIPLATDFEGRMRASLGFLG